MPGRCDPRRPVATSRTGMGNEDGRAGRHSPASGQAIAPCSTVLRLLKVKGLLGKGKVAKLVSGLTTVMCFPVSTFIHLFPCKY